jgi:catechol 2,3-dioxygenase-like lactoylglutathione lyase family enzyme
LFVFDAEPAPFRLLAASPGERYLAEMAKITGLGGIFYKVADPDATRAWYQDNLGIGGEWGAMFPFKNDDPEGFTLLSPFKADTDYFAPSDKAFMINLRVDDLDGMIGQLEAKEISILGRQDEDYGRFAWILDPDGNKVELWQQLGPAPE